MAELLSTKEVARFLGVNEKMVYSLVSEKGLPASKITGKWLFPRHLVEQWVDAHTVNYPQGAGHLPPYEGLLIITGSNDLLLERTIEQFNITHREHVAVFGNLGSMGGLRALRQNFCHMAASHLLQEDDEEYNFDFAAQELQGVPVVINFCRREQGLLVNPATATPIRQVADLGRPKIRLANRPVGTGTRLLLDRELKRAGLRAESIQGYDREFSSHLAVGLEVLAGRADVAPGIRTVATLLNLEFIPLRWERYDLLVTRERFFDQGIQLFLGQLHETAFSRTAQELTGYDVSLSGRMVFPQQ